MQINCVSVKVQNRKSQKINIVTTDLKLFCPTEGLGSVLAGLVPHIRRESSVEPRPRLEKETRDQLRIHCINQGF